MKEQSSLNDRGVKVTHEGKNNRNDGSSHVIFS